MFWTTHGDSTGAYMFSKDLACSRSCGQCVRDMCTYVLTWTVGLGEGDPMA